jgi:NADH-quinone oxidoreductase subunit A
MPVTTDPVELTSGVLLFVAAGILMVVGALLAGSLIRRQLFHPVKAEAYECGEPPIGESWVQFDLRMYVVALVFIVFDVEIVLFWPWAVVYKQAGWAGLWDMLFFFAVLVAGFVFLWRFGYLDWVRSSAGQAPQEKAELPIAGSASGT